MGIRSYPDLVAWQLGVELSLRIYRCTSSLPGDERFGLVSQLRRAAVSVPSNIAEGYGRGSTSDYVRFLKVARGSLFELQTQVLITNRLGFLAGEAFEQLEEKSNELGRVLAGLIKSLESGAKEQPARPTA
ncbi:MAG: four helix bundle protein [Planctomycetota bacterium]